MAPPPALAMIRHRQGDEVLYKRTAEFLSLSLDPQKELSLPRLPGFAAKRSCIPVYRSVCRDNPRQLTVMFHSLMDLEKGRHLPEWDILCSIARDAAHTLEPSGAAAASLGRTSNSDSVSEFLWFECLFEIALQGELLNPSTAVRMVVLPRGRRACVWQAEAWQQERDLNSEVLRRQQRGDPQCATASAVPEEEWPTELPQTWFSILLDVPNRSVEMIDWILALRVESDSIAVERGRGAVAIEAPKWPPGNGWSFRPGSAAFLGHSFTVTEQQRVFLSFLAEKRGDLITWRQLADKWDLRKNSASAPGNISQAIYRIRKLLQEQFDCGNQDPIPNVEMGNEFSYRLDDTVIVGPRTAG